MDWRFIYWILAEVSLRILLTVCYYKSTHLRILTSSTFPNDTQTDVKYKETISDLQLVICAIIVFLYLIIHCLLVSTKQYFSSARNPCLNARRYEASFTKTLVLDMLHLIFAFSLAVLLDGILVNILKAAIRRQRPDFLVTCYAMLNEINKEKCYANVSKMSDLVKSFPSGHASISFNVFIFLSLYMYKQGVCVISHQFHVFPTIVCLTSPCIALYISVTRIIDRRHHPSDVVVGAFIGAFLCLGSYLTYFGNPFFNSISKNNFPAQCHSQRYQEEDNENFLVNSKDGQEQSIP